MHVIRFLQAGYQRLWFSARGDARGEYVRRFFTQFFDYFGSGRGSVGGGGGEGMSAPESSCTRAQHHLSPSFSLSSPSSTPLEHSVYQEGGGLGGLGGATGGTSTAAAILFDNQVFELVFAQVQCIVLVAVLVVTYIPHFRTHAHLLRTHAQRQCACAHLHLLHNKKQRQQ